MTQPKRMDEVQLYGRLKHEAFLRGKNQPGMSNILAVAKEMGMAEGRLYYLLDKWTGKGWWNWGMNQAGGWFEPDAPDSIE